MIQITKHGRLKDGTYGIAYIDQNGMKDGAVITTSGKYEERHYVYYKLNGSEEKVGENELNAYKAIIESALSEILKKNAEEKARRENYLAGALKKVHSLKSAAQVGGYIHFNQIRGKKEGIPIEYWLDIKRQHIPAHLPVASVKAEYKEAVAKSIKRVPVPAPTNTKAERIQRLFSRKQTFAKYLPDSGYSMGEIKKIYANDVLISHYDNTKEYSKSCKYKARHGSVHIDLTLPEAYNLKVVANILTITGPLIGRGVRTAKWADSVNFKFADSVKWAHGYLAGDYHFTANNDKEARAIAKKYYSEKKANEAVKRKHAYALKRSNLKTFVSYEDSRRAGNCEIGTKGFARHAGIKLYEIGAIRADFLLKLAENHNVINYANRAIETAKLRYAGIIKSNANFENEI
jgi:hypothetical protein